MTWIKICGITNTGDAEITARLGADALGFIFSTGSPRRIWMEPAEKIIGYIRSKNTAGGGMDKSGTGNRPEDYFATGGPVSMVGVFVNESMEKIRKYQHVLALDHIQLSGDEDRDYLASLRRGMPGTKIIKTIRIKENTTTCLDRLEDYIISLDGLADFILLDSYHKEKYGGTGKTIDWEIASRYSANTRLILSGGLDHSNVGTAISTVKPFGVDASSRLEISPGKKDHRKVKSFIAAVRNIN